MAANTTGIFGKDHFTDRETGRAKGFGFVEMKTEDASRQAIQRFNGYMLKERRLTVNEARPREERPRNDFGGIGNRRPQSRNRF